MYSLYSIDPKNFAMQRVAEGEHRGPLSLKMNSLKSSNKSNIYALYRGNVLLSSMLNK